MSKNKRVAASQARIVDRARAVAEQAVAAVIFQTLRQAAAQATLDVMQQLQRHKIVDRHQVAKYIASAFRKHV